ncbi:MAG TPA: hypothetical protein VF855_13805 [Acidimicrobiales bacterium]
MLKKVLLIVFGVIVAAAGAGMVVTGIRVTAQFGPDGMFESNTGSLVSQGRAFVVNTHVVEEIAPYGFGGRSIAVRAQDRAADSEVFIGVGRKDQVDAYLTAVAFDEITDIEPEPFAATTTAHAGAGSPGAPASETFWIEKAQGTGEQRVDWDLEDGDFKVVVMNADAASLVDVRSGFEVEIPWMFPAGVSLIVAGALVLLIGFAMVVGGIKSPVISTPKLPESPLPKPLGGAMGPTP